MRKQHLLMLKVLKHFAGLNKLDAFDLLQKMEVTLFYTTNPITVKNIKQVLSTNNEKIGWIDPFHFTFLPNGNLCEFVGSNKWIQIYKEKNRVLPDWEIFNRYYYKTAYAPIDLLKLNRKNLLESIEGKTQETNVKEFLTQYRITQKDNIYNRLLLLDI
ncbi:hypothetical protein [Aquimarina sp. I32.4]|uniref:hypothetical protein n=1 Tax=Aquimarina sp. I32.4 TaxID=2053903 RepID=UPI000CDE6F95|nr:hypothetical protein [Aquimarina sp. I32.4]